MIDLCGCSLPERTEDIADRSVIDLDKLKLLNHQTGKWIWRYILNYFRSQTWSIYNQSVEQTWNIILWENIDPRSQSIRNNKHRNEFLVWTSLNQFWNQFDSDFQNIPERVEAFFSVFLLIFLETFQTHSECFHQFMYWSDWTPSSWTGFSELLVLICSNWSSLDVFDLVCLVLN